MLKFKIMRRNILTALFLFLTFAISIQAQKSEKFSKNISDWLIMNGSVAEMSLTDTPSEMEVKLKLDLIIKNVGEKPVFIYEKNPQIGVQKLALSLEDDRKFEYAYKISFGLANNYGSQESLKQIKNLDKKSVPKELFLVILPDEEKKLELVTYLELDKKPYNYDKSWAEISKQYENWLRVGIKLWRDSNLEAGNKLEFGKKLQKRWQNEGYLALGYLISEPIKLTFPKKINCQ